MAKGDAGWVRQQLTRAVELRQGGNLRRADDVVDRVLERAPEDLNALRLSGRIAWERGDRRKALDRLVAAARLDPSDAPTMDLVGAVAAALDRYDIAGEAMEYAVVADPADARRQLRLGAAYLGAGRLEAALGHGQLAVMLDPDDADAHRLCADSHYLMDRQEEALTAYERVLTLRPDDARSMVGQANVLDALGRSPEATSCRERAADLAPDDPVVGFHTKDLFRYRSDAPQIAGMRRAAADEDAPVEDRVLAHLALAKMLDDASDTAAAAEHAREGNALRQRQLERRGRQYRPEAEERTQTLICAASGPMPPESAGTEVAGPRPVLLTGLPRAGKSLLEARLAAHPDVVALGERPVLVGLMERFEEMTGRVFPDDLPNLDATALTALRDALRAAVAPHVHGDAAAYTLTSPAGNKLVGLAVAVDPRTVVVHCDRDPRDLLLANYLQWFPVGQSFSTTIDGLVHHHRMQTAYAAHWADVLGDRFVRVAYEDLIADPSATLEMARAAASLPAAGEASTTARTDDGEVAASPTARPDPQAPLHRVHVGMWRRWAAHLPELFDAIDATA